MSNYVPAEGPKPCRIMLVGEAPGKDENRERRPFVGKSGKELDHAYLPLAGLRRSQVYITNLWKYQPPGNRDPKPDEIATGLLELLDEIDHVNPEIIICAGRISAGALLGNQVNMYREHGIPQWFGNRILIPVYHPAAGLHDSKNMTFILDDYRNVARVIRGELQPVSLKLVFSGQYKVASLANIHSHIRAADVVALDTETDEDGKPWSVQLSAKEGEAWVVMVDDKSAISYLQQLLPSKTVIMHNAPYDLMQLRRLGIHVNHFYDTMSMAYLLGNLPMGLKLLAYRLLHQDMMDFSGVVAHATKKNAVDYLNRILEMDFPQPASVIEYVKQVPKIRQPQHIHTKVKALLKKLESDPDADPVEKWKNMKDKDHVVNMIGDMKMGAVSQIPFDLAINYGGQDADVTLQVYNYLLPIITESGLIETLERDMGMIPVIVDMMENGMGVDIHHLSMLSVEFEQRAERLLWEINDEIKLPDGHVFNPNSHDQVKQYAEKHKVILESTEAKYLQKYTDKLPVIGKILEYKHMVKLRSTYVLSLLDKADSDHRVHAQIRHTVADTGRLTSEEPNLQNIPTRTKDGERIRGAFVANVIEDEEN